MGAIAEKYCNEVILTNEDPYDENPEKIVSEMKKGMSEVTHVTIIMDREEALREAINRTPQGGYTIISGKGTDPYIMGPDNTKVPWSDAEMVQTILAEMVTDRT